MPYIPTLSNDYGLATFLALIPGHFPIAEKMWTSWFKNVSPLVVHLVVKMLVVLIAFLTIEKNFVHFVLFKYLILKIILGIFAGYLFYLLEIQINRKTNINNINNKALEAVYNMNTKIYASLFLVLNALFEEIIFRKYLSDFIYSLNSSFLVFYALVIFSMFVFGFIHISFGVEKFYTKSMFALVLLSSTFICHDIVVAIVAHAVSNLSGLFCGKTIQLRRHNV